MAIKSRINLLKFAPALIIAPFVAGCGGSGSGGADNPVSAVPSIMKSGAPATVSYTKLPNGTFALKLVNASNGTVPDSQIFVEIVSLPNGKVTIVDAGPQIVPDGPEGEGALGTVQVANANESLATHAFSLAQLPNKTIYLPGDAQFLGSRIYISIGQPLQMAVNQTADGYVQPNIENPSDPNYSTRFDWFEMAYAPQNNPQVAFGGNITQVDGFSIPMSFTVEGVKNTVLTRGITLGEGSSSGVATRDALINKFLTDPSIDAPFKTLAQYDTQGNVIRLISPYHSTTFRAGGSGQSYFDQYVNDVWQYYASNPLNFNDQPDGSGNNYQGRLVTNASGAQVFRVSRNGGPEFDMPKPSTNDVLTNSGALQPGGTDANAFGALLAGAINRHVATQPQNWLTPASFYQATPSNEWAMFWHQVSIDGLAYGMGFDDTANQSSVAILPADENLKQLTISIGW